MKAQWITNNPEAAKRLRKADRRYQAARDNARDLPLEKKIVALRKASADLEADYAADGTAP